MPGFKSHISLVYRWSLLRFYKVTVLAIPYTLWKFHAELIVHTVNFYLLPDLQAAVEADPNLSGGRCLVASPTKSYDFLPIQLDDLLCRINTIFQALTRSPAAQQVAGQFGPFVYIASGIVAYESFKQPSFLARRGLPILMVAQVVSAGGTLPFYFALLASSRWTHKARQGDQIRPDQVWSILIALIVGYILPARNLVKTGWSYDALSIWQIFPIYMIIITTILPFILRPFLKNTPSANPIYILATLGVYLSADGHYRMLASGIDFRDVAMIFPQPAGLTRDAHFFFLADYLFCIIAVGSHVVFSFEASTSEEKLGYFLCLFFGSQVVGMGGAVSVLWAYREIFDSQRIARRQKRRATKKVQ